MFRLSQFDQRSIRLPHSILTGSGPINIDPHNCLMHEQICAHTRFWKANTLMANIDYASQKFDLDPFFKFFQLGQRYDFASLGAEYFDWGNYIGASLFTRGVHHMQYVIRSQSVLIDKPLLPCVYLYDVNNMPDVSFIVSSGSEDADQIEILKHACKKASIFLLLAETGTYKSDHCTLKGNYCVNGLHYASPGLARFSSILNGEYNYCLPLGPYEYDCEAYMFYSNKGGSFQEIMDANLNLSTRKIPSSEPRVYVTPTNTGGGGEVVMTSPYNNFSWQSCRACNEKHYVTNKLSVSKKHCGLHCEPNYGAYYCRPADFPWHYLINDQLPNSFQNGELLNLTIQV